MARQLTIAQIEALADRFDKRALAATIETDRSDFQLAFLDRKHGR